MAVWIQPNKYELQAQAEVYNLGLEAYGEELALSKVEVETFGEALAEYRASLASLDALRTAAQAAMELFESNREEMVTLMRRYSKRMQSSSALTNDKRAAIGLTISDGRSKVVPHEVKGLILNATGIAEVKLKWKRGENQPAIIFVVESSDDGVHWHYVANTRKISMTVTHIEPGRQRFFRVIATREAQRALPSEPVVIYPAGGGSISLRSAA